MKVYITTINNGEEYYEDYNESPAGVFDNFKDAVNIGCKKSPVGASKFEVLEFDINSTKCSDSFNFYRTKNKWYMMKGLEDILVE